MELTHGHTMRRAGLARRMGVWVAIACALAGCLAASALARSHAGPPPPVAAVDTRTGHRLPVDPVLEPGQHVTLTVRGFASRAKVVLVFVRVGRLATLTADRSGRVVYVFVVPRGLHRGHYLLIFSGPARTRSGGAPPTVHSASTRDPQIFRVTVPYDAQWPFRIGGPPSHPSPSSHGASGVGGQHGHHGGTSFTGTDVLGVLLAALLALGLGVAVLRVARRPRRGQ